jgi:heme-degrading monooxygenase HmoA
VILRIWRAKLNPARLAAYRHFELERSLPMYRKQPGLLGVLFLREAEDRAASLTVWEDRGAVEALTSSPSYRETTHELAESALLAGDHSVEVLEVEGGDLRLEALLGALDRTKLSQSRRADSNRFPAHYEFAVIGYAQYRSVCEIPYIR